MSMTFYCYRKDATTPVGSHGPLTELDDMYHLGGPRTIDVTIEQEREAGWFNGPNLANDNALMIVRSLGYEVSDGNYCFTLDPHELMGKVTMGRAVPPVDDGGMPTIEQGNMILCGVRPGYFSEVYEQIAEVCEQAIKWGVLVTVA